MEIKLLSATEVAQLLNVPVTWVEAQTRQGNIPKVLGLGKYVRFHPDVINKHFFSNETGSLKFEFNQRKRKQTAF